MVSHFQQSIHFTRVFNLITRPVQYTYRHALFLSIQRPENNTHLKNNCYRLQNDVMENTEGDSTTMEINTSVQEKRNLVTYKNYKMIWLRKLHQKTKIPNLIFDIYNKEESIILKSSERCLSESPSLFCSLSIGKYRVKTHSDKIFILLFSVSLSLAFRVRIQRISVTCPRNRGGRNYKRRSTTLIKTYRKSWTRSTDTQTHT